MGYAYSESKPPPIAGLVLVDPALANLTNYTHVKVQQFIDTTLRLFEANDLTRFPAGAELALKVGGVLTFKLQRHHSSHLHETVLVLSRFQLLFDPEVPKWAPDQAPLALPCTYEAFTNPSLGSSLETGGSSSRRSLLTLKVLNAKGKIYALFFADRSAQMKEAVSPKAGGMTSESGHIIDSRPESYSALTSIAKAFQLADGLANSSKQGVQ